MVYSCVLATPQLIVLCASKVAFDNQHRCQIQRSYFTACKKGVSVLFLARMKATNFWTNSEGFRDRQGLERESLGGQGCTPRTSRFYTSFLQGRRGEKAFHLLAYPSHPHPLFVSQKPSQRRKDKIKSLLPRAHMLRKDVDACQPQSRVISCFVALWRDSVGHSKICWKDARLSKT